MKTSPSAIWYAIPMKLYASVGPTSLLKIVTLHKISFLRRLKPRKVPVTNIQSEEKPARPTKFQTQVAFTWTCMSV